MVDSSETFDGARFDREFEAAAPALYAWADLRLRGATRLHLDAADLVQEVGLRAWRGRDGLAPDVPVRAWLFRIAKNVMLEAIRAGQRGAAGSAAVGPTTKLFALENAPDSATAVSRRLARDEGVAAFAETVQALPEEDRKLVLLYGIEGASRPEVAARLEISEDAVSKRWSRLKERLRERDLGERFLVAR